MMPRFLAIKTSILAALFTGVLLTTPGCVPDRQQSTSDQFQPETPDLVVGLIVDQLRPDYIYRFWDHFEEGGFRRLVNEGTTFRNAWFRHLQTSTGPGHAAQLTGTSPMIHGLIGNSWYVRDLGRNINVIEDVGSGYQGVGSLPDYPGEKSPNNMLTTTVGDELHLFTGAQSRTIGISRKDRGAILPAGHTGDAYWYEGATGNFITSTYYRNELPGWLQEFNNRDLAQEYLTRTWDTLLPIEEYVKSRADDNPYEGTFPGMDTPTFPIDLAQLVADHNQGPGLLNLTPFSDELLIELAIAAIEGEELGRRGVPDILSVGLSATDAIGHRFGPASMQIQDQILRLDRNLARLFDYLDEQFGMNNVLIYLTADHGGAYIPEYLSDLGIPTGHTEFGTSAAGQVAAAVREFLEETYGENFLLSFSNQNLYLDHDYIEEHGLSHAEIQESVRRFVLTLHQVGGAVTGNSLINREFTVGTRAQAMYAYYPQRSGDVVVWLKPQTQGSGTGGTGHGSSWAYDANIPLHFMGFRVPAGQSYEKAYVSDIASTVSVFLNSPFPSGNIGNPLNGYME